MIDSQVHEKRVSSKLLSSSMDMDAQSELKVGATEGRGKHLRIVIIGGSITGLSCAHALLKAGVCTSQTVTVLERARKLTSAGAGIALDLLSCKAFKEWGLHDELLRNAKPMPSEENRAVDKEAGVFIPLSRDDEWYKQAVHWSDLHRILYNSLPSGVARYGHEVSTLEVNEDGSYKVTAIVATGEAAQDGSPTVTTKEFLGDVVVGADGSMSQTRKLLVPKETRRYSGYCALRGVLDYNDIPEVYDALKEAYPDIGKASYYDLAPGTHTVLYELTGKRLNWIWYVTQPEPELKGNSVTKQPDKDDIKAIHDAADRTFLPALANLMKHTPKPFINAIYDRDPLKQLVWGKVVLTGEAAHPSTPHAVRSTNMSVGDAYVLGKAFEKWGSENISEALAEFESIRLPSTSQHLLFSRHLGKLKQGMLFEPKGSFAWPTVDAQFADGLLMRNQDTFGPRYYGVPH